MNNKIGFVAIGQAAGNIGQLLEVKGYPVLYINTSKEDLDTLKDAKYKYHIPNGEGCNKDRHKAKQLVVDDFDHIAAEIDAKVQAELIFVIFASGGGTGSGAGPMLTDLLIDEGRAIGMVSILPGIKESVKSHINAYECFSELTEIAGTASCFILDNENGEKLSLNMEFVENFDSFVTIPEKHKSVKGNIDRAEIMETLKAHGMAYVLQSHAETAQMIDIMKSNMFAQMEGDGVVKYITASLSDNVQMSDLEKAVGTPIDNFQTFNNANEIICCVSGLSYPQTRLDIIYEKVDENRDIIKKNLLATNEVAMKKGINFLEDLEPAKKAEKKPQSRRDIMSKYL